MLRLILLSTALTCSLAAEFSTSASFIVKVGSTKKVIFVRFGLKFERMETVNAITMYELLLKVHMGEISQGVQSLNLMSYLLGVLGPFFGDLGLCYGKN